MRIVAGRHRGKRIEAPKGRDMRPTADRVRESVFNILAHGAGRRGGADAITGARVLDGFAGTGAMGLEALSRGALHATLMDDNPEALACCRANVAVLGEAQNVTILQGDCLNPVRPLEACSLVFLDPPYTSGIAPQALQALAEAGWIDEGTVCIIETAAKENFFLPDGFTLLDERRYGAARVSFVERDG
jgi:16S rRNA (guanine966-N2)-methyltransferase